MPGPFDMLPAEAPKEEFKRALAELGDLTQRMARELRTKGGLTSKEVSIVIADNIAAVALKPVTGGKIQLEESKTRGTTPQQKYVAYMSTEAGAELGGYRAEVLPKVQEAIQHAISEDSYDVYSSQIDQVGKTIQSNMEKALNNPKAV